jgi:hypothetical protein
VVLNAQLQLRHDEKKKIEAKVKALMDKRKDRQPWGLPNAGSMFKNPLDESAGKLIESAGLKGRTVGGAQVSEKHANFIVNTGKAKAAGNPEGFVKVIFDAKYGEWLGCHMIGSNVTEMIAEVVGFHGAIVPDPSKPDGTPVKRTDMSLMRSLGWQASIPLREGIQRTYETYISELETATIRRS